MAQFIAIEQWCGEYDCDESGVRFHEIEAATLAEAVAKAGSMWIGGTAGTLAINVYEVVAFARGTVDFAKQEQRCKEEREQRERAQALAKKREEADRLRAEIAALEAE